jgi:hypothetical protein
VNISFYIHLKYLVNETWRFLQVPSNADRGEGGEDDNATVAPWNKKDEDGTSGSAPCKCSWDQGVLTRGWTCTSGHSPDEIIQQLSEFRSPFSIASHRILPPPQSSFFIPSGDFPVTRPTWERCQLSSGKEEFRVHAMHKGIPAVSLVLDWTRRAGGERYPSHLLTKFASRRMLSCWLAWDFHEQLGEV